MHSLARRVSPTGSARSGRTDRVVEPRRRPPFEGFTLNHRKTRCLTASRRQAVCSIVVNRHPNLPRPEFDRLKAILHQCVTSGPTSQNREGKPHWREYLHGRVAWAAQLNPAKAQRLKRLLDQIDWSR